MKKTLLITLLVLGFLLSVVFYAYTAYTEYTTNRIASEYYNNEEYGELYDFYFNPQPAIAERAFIGNKSAGITLTVVIDPVAGQTHQFMQETVEHLTQAYVHTGQAKLYFKYYMTEEEYEQKKGRFIYASAGHCYNGTDGFTFHKELTATAEKDVPALLEKHGVQATTSACASDELLYEDMIESHLFRIVSPSVHVGINGTQNTVLVNPSIERLDSEIKFKQVGIGI